VGLYERWFFRGQRVTTVDVASASGYGQSWGIIPGGCDILVNGRVPHDVHRKPDRDGLADIVIVGRRWGNNGGIRARKRASSRHTANGERRVIAIGVGMTSRSGAP